MNGFGAIYRLVLGAIVTRGRFVLLVALGAIAIILGFAIASNDPFDPVRQAVGMVNGYGLAVLVPIVALVFASAALGDMVEDSTLVYLWLRPVGRETIALAAVAAATTITVPVVAVPLVLASLLASGGDVDTAVGTALAVGLCAVAYSGLFVALGLRANRALVWGITYVLIWEGFVARAGDGVARLSIQTYGRSVLAEAADVKLDLAGISPAIAIIVPVLVALVGVALTTRFLHQRDVA